MDQYRWTSSAQSSDDTVDEYAAIPDEVQVELQDLISAYIAKPTKANKNKVDKYALSVADDWDIDAWPPDDATLKDKKVTGIQKLENG